MPIVDGLTSTKMIRSYEKTHSPSILSPRAALNGRVPIIAVSASLIEKERQIYIDAGFDAWILKPISFDRLSQLLTAIVDPQVRHECLYEPGEWERGGWFHADSCPATGVNTRPSNEDFQTNTPGTPGDDTESSTPRAIEPESSHSPDEADLSPVSKS
jgi:DNA-binding response OmpR family regulator